jgi:SAM-dependent methyltransferase
MKITGSLKNWWIRSATLWQTTRHRTMFATIRHVIASRYLKGEGLEIGALHNPLILPKGAKARYVDKWTSEHLAATFPELKERKLVRIDIIDDGETLANIAESSVDFIVANHLLEHCRNPIRTIERMFALLRVGGVLYLTVPDKRYTFGAPRNVTPVQHLIREYREGTEWSQQAHADEYARDALGITDADEFEKKVREILASGGDSDMHWHVWTQDEILEIIPALKREVGLSFETELFFRNGDFEVIFLLRKTSP